MRWACSIPRAGGGWGSAETMMMTAGRWRVRNRGQCCQNLASWWGEGIGMRSAILHWLSKMLENTLLPLFSRDSCPRPVSFWPGASE